MKDVDICAFQSLYFEFAYWRHFRNAENAKKLIMAGAGGHQHEKTFLDFLNVVFTCCVINVIIIYSKGVEAHSQGKDEESCTVILRMK